MSTQSAAQLEAAERAAAIQHRGEIARDDFLDELVDSGRSPIRARYRVKLVGHPATPRPPSLQTTVTTILQDTG